MFRSDNQNFWQLAVIQSSSIGLQGLLIMRSLSSHYGVGTALLALCIGNLILWFFGLSMISMTYRENTNGFYREHALQNVQNYLGTFATIISSLVLTAAFLSWFALQLSENGAITRSLLSHHPNWTVKLNIQLCAFLAIMITYLSMGGIRTIILNDSGSFRR